MGTDLAVTSTGMVALEDELRDLAGGKMAAEAVAIIIAAYPQRSMRDASEGRIYIRLLTDLLASYPKSIVARAVDPRTGIIGSHRFMPSVAEVRGFLDALLDPKRRTLSRQQRISAQLEDRAAWEEWKLPANAAKRREHIDRVMRRLGRSLRRA